VNRSIARLGIGLMACYLALFVMVNYVQVVASDDLNAHPDNTRTLRRDFDRNRGRILTADGTELAITLPANGTGFEYQRAYPTGDLFGHVTGHLNFSQGPTGAERAFEDYLTGEDADVEYQSISDIFVDRERVADVTLTVRNDVQVAARDAVNGLQVPRASVVALDPRSGAVLAMYSTPAYDPNRVATHDQAAADAAFAEFAAASPNPMRARAYQERFFPGSTFKVVTGSIGLDTGVVTPAEPRYPTATEFDIDFTSDELSNFGGSSCGGALPEILRVSCNSAFADMGANTIGQARMVEGAERFGFNQDVPFDLPAAAESVFPTEFPEDQGNGPLARASIGQGDVSASPLEMAMVAAAVANDGVLMTPHVLDRVTDERGEVIDQYEPEPWLEAVRPEAAAAMRQAMIGVVESGSGTRAQIAGLEVGGKTGTAQLGTEQPSSHAWFIAFAGQSGQQPEIAVAVLVEAQAGVSEVTGGRLAAPVAAAVIRAALGAA
jgi:peptidoglycan glycosyltransferase